MVLALYDEYADSVYRVALGYLRAPCDAQDAVQSVFCKLLERELTVYPGRERAFLTKLTINHSSRRRSGVRRRRWTSWSCRQSRRTGRCGTR